MANKTYKDLLLKAAGFCAYQERCHEEVRSRLHEWGVWGTDAETIILTLIEQNYLNEERFAKAFAGGKFRTRQWGRVKIRLELKARKISDYCIRKGMEEIDEDDYLHTLKGLVAEKLGSLKGGHSLANNAKAAKYLIGRGYEADLVWEAIRNVRG